MHAINTCFGKICKIPTSAWRYLLLQGNLAAVVFLYVEGEKGNDVCLQKLIFAN